MTTLEDLQVGLGLAAAEVLALLRSEPDVDALTPGGEWTVRDTAVHLICVPRMYTRQLNGQPAPFGSLPEPAAWNAGTFLALAEDRPTALADLAEEAVASFLDVTTRRHRDDPIQYVAFATSVGGLSAFLCGEYLLHGFDIASSVGRGWSWAEPAADAALAMMAP